MSKSYNIKLGGGIGSVIAAIMSYAINHSIGWLILHAICGWVYVIYGIFCYGQQYLDMLHNIYVKIIG